VETAAIVLAAGESSRMKSDLVKVLHPLAGLEMIKHVIRNVRFGSFGQIYVVIGHQGEKVQAVLDGVKFVKQKKRLGTGHAVDQCRSFLADFDGSVLVTYGDTPLFRKETFQELVAFHEKSGASATILTAELADPTGYGRILRDEQGVCGVVEQKDATAEELAIREINTGTYCFNSRLLFQYLKQITPDNVQAEYYLPDVLPLFLRDGHQVAGYILKDAAESMGINDRRQLAEAEAILRDRLARFWQNQGVTLIDPETIWIEYDCIIGQDTIIYPNTFLQKGTVIGSRCRIGPNCRLKAARVGDEVVMESAVVEGCSVETGAVLAPFTYLTSENGG